MTVFLELRTILAEQFITNINNYSKSIKEIRKTTQAKTSDKHEQEQQETSGKKAIAQRSSMLSVTAQNIAILLIIRYNKDCEHCSKDALACPRRDGALDRPPCARRKLWQYTPVKPR